MTDNLDLRDRSVAGGFFVWRRAAPQRSEFEPADDTADEPYRHCFTYEGGGSTIHRELISMIEGAQRKIFVAALTLGDKDLREALMHAAARLRGGVYVVSALDDKGLEEAINEYDDDDDIDRQVEHRNFRELTRHGIYVRGYRGLHAKFAVVDDQVALVSSANLVTRSFREIGENGVIVTDPGDVDVLARVFARLWQLSQWDMPPNATNPGIVDSHTPETRIPAPTAARAGTGPIWTWGNGDEDHHIARTIVEVADSAQSDLVIATFSIVGIAFKLQKYRSRPDLLLEPVRRAVERGVRVRVLMRGRNFLPAAREEAAALADAGAEIIPDRRNHAKGIIADRERGALFSANFTVPRGLTGGVEMGMRLDGTAALTEAHRYFEHVIAEADMEFVRDPTLGDLAETLYADALTRWPLPRTISVDITDGDWESLASGQGLVAYERVGNDSPVTLYSGRRSWTLQRESDSLTLTRNGDPSRQNAAEIFEEWLTSGEKTQAQRGLCPATLVRRAGLAHAANSSPGGSPTGR